MQRRWQGMKYTDTVVVSRCTNEMATSYWSWIVSLTLFEIGSVVLATHVTSLFLLPS